MKWFLLIEKQGRWVLHGTYDNEPHATRDADILTQAGLKVKVQASKK